MNNISDELNTKKPFHILDEEFSIVLVKDVDLRLVYDILLQSDVFFNITQDKNNISILMNKDDINIFDSGMILNQDEDIYKIIKIDPVFIQKAYAIMNGSKHKGFNIRWMDNYIIFSKNIIEDVINYLIF